jgi:hypothetical protein
MNIGQLKAELERYPDHVEVRLLDHDVNSLTNPVVAPKLGEVHNVLDYVENEGIYILLVPR